MQLRLKDVWENLPNNKYTEKYFDNNTKLMIYEICGKKFHETCCVEYMFNSIKGIISSYGSRAKLARSNKGLDWKAISHAFRVGSELKDLYKSGMISYPLKDADFIKSIKNGEFEFSDLSEEINSMVEEVTDIANNSNFPNELNIGEIDDFLFNILRKELSTLYKGDNND